MSAKVDTSAPATPSLSASGTGAGEYVTGSTVYYNPQGSNSGSFTVSGTTTDGDSQNASACGFWTCLKLPLATMGAQIGRVTDT